MKLIKQDIEITMDQLKELYQDHPADLKCLLESTICQPYHNVDSYVDKLENAVRFSRRFYLTLHDKH